MTFYTVFSVSNDVTILGEIPQSFKPPSFIGAYSDGEVPGRWFKMLEHKTSVICLVQRHSPGPAETEEGSHSQQAEEASG